VAHGGQYAAFVVPAEAVVPILQRSGRLASEPADASAIDVLYSAARKNKEMTSVALVSVDELLSTYDARVKPLAVRSLDGVQRPADEIILRECFTGRRGQALQALSSRLRDFQRSEERTLPGPGPACRNADRLPVVFDMETEDPDDVLTLLFLAAHAAVDLKAVTLTPGSEFQVSLIRWVLNQVGLSEVRIGAQDWPKNKKAAPPKGRFYSNFGQLPTKDTDCERASQVLVDCCDESTTLLTGGPLTNLSDALAHSNFKLGRWVAQGGFAGAGVDNRKENPFKGKTYCRTTNFGSDSKAAHCALRSKSIGRRVCVSKNVCHQTLYADGAGGWHAAVLAALNETTGRSNRRRALQLMHTAMTDYFRRSEGKKLHDPLALAVALDESVCTLVEVEMDSKGQEWCSWLCVGSNTWISVDYDESKFRTTLLRDGFVPRPATLPTKEQEPPKGPVGGLTCEEKNVMKLAKKVREINRLEERREAGEALDIKQQEKIKIKEGEKG
jgi:pyrimidine-specific ribonucleoside hydrolase